MHEHNHGREVHGSVMLVDGVPRRVRSYMAKFPRQLGESDRDSRHRRRTVAVLSWWRLCVTETDVDNVYQKESRGHHPMVVQEWWSSTRGTIVVKETWWRQS